MLLVAVELAEQQLADALGGFLELILVRGLHERSGVGHLLYDDPPVSCRRCAFMTLLPPASFVQPTPLLSSPAALNVLSQAR